MAKNSGFMGYFFGTHYEYVRSLKPLFILSLLIFTFSMASGWILGEDIAHIITQDLAEMLPEIEDSDITSLFSLILFNNLFVNLLWMVLGLFGAFPSVYFSSFNGFILGAFAYTFALETSNTLVVVGLLPHGIIEIPTMILSSSMGMGLGYTVINRLRGKGSIRKELNHAIKLYIRRIIPLVILAAIIEVTITPLLIGIFSLTL